MVFMPNITYKSCYYLHLLSPVVFISRFISLHISGKEPIELVGDRLSFIKDNKTYLENMKDGKSIVMFIAVFFF